MDYVGTNFTNLTGTNLNTATPTGLAVDLVNSILYWGQTGGTAVGEIVSLTTAAGARVTWCYVTDPEGNVIELQSWS